jgi:hypothetical protein
LDGGFARRREVAEDLVHVEHRAQARGAGLRRIQATTSLSSSGHEEHALGVVQVRDREDG